jgi:hypothetical protein
MATRFVDIASPLGKFDALSELALPKAAFDAENLDSSSRQHSCGSYFQRSCCHGSSCSVHSPVWLTGDRRLCCAALNR